MPLPTPGSDPWLASYEKAEVVYEKKRESLRAPLTPIEPKKDETGNVVIPRRFPRGRIPKPGLPPPPEVPSLEPIIEMMTTPSEDVIAREFVTRYTEHYYVPAWKKWLNWDGKKWAFDEKGIVWERIRLLARESCVGKKNEARTANSRFISGVEHLLRTDQSMVMLPNAFDADPWILNTQSGIVDLKTGELLEHDPRYLCTKITRAEFKDNEGLELWLDFLADVTQGDTDLASYLQRLAGYCATGSITEDILVFIFGPGGNGKGTFAEAIAHVLGSYAKMFSPDVLVETQGNRHPTELAQFLGARFALTSEPPSNATWNDSRVKSLTGDSTINARFMGGNFFDFERTHKTMILGNHMPRLNEVSASIRRRVQVVPFRAVFENSVGDGMRERLKREAGGAILSWIIGGAKAWAKEGTKPPRAVAELTSEYISDQDLIGQWLQERTERAVETKFERSGDLHKNYSNWCEGQGYRPKSNLKLSEYLSSAGYLKKVTAIGRVFAGIQIKYTGD